MKKLLLSICALTSYTLTFGQGENSGFYPSVANGNFESINPNSITNYFSSWDISTVPAVTDFDTSFVNQVDAVNYPVSGKAMGLPTVLNTGNTYFAIASQQIDFTANTSNATIRLPQYLVGAYNYQSTDPNHKFEVTAIGKIGNLIINNKIQLGVGAGIFNLPLSGTACSGKGCTAPTYLTIRFTSCGNCTNTGGSGPERISAMENIIDYLILDNVKFNESIVTAIENEFSNTPSIYPNPVTDILNVNSFAEIFNTQGEKVAEGTDKINLSNLTSGIYILKSNNYSYKILKN